MNKLKTAAMKRYRKPYARISPLEIILRRSQQYGDHLVATERAGDATQAIAAAKATDHQQQGQRSGQSSGGQSQ